jgi:hypothetical protein
VAIADEPLRGVKFELYCGDCGYAVSVRVPPEECPMCRGSAWEHRPWRPFSLLVDDVLHREPVPDADRRL